MLQQAGRFAPFGMTRGRGLYSPSVENENTLSGEYACWTTNSGYGYNGPA